MKGDEKPKYPDKEAAQYKEREGISLATVLCFHDTLSPADTDMEGEITDVERLFSINIYLFFQRNSLNIFLAQSNLICLGIP